MHFKLKFRLIRNLNYPEAGRMSGPNNCQDIRHRPDILPDIPFKLSDRLLPDIRFVPNHFFRQVNSACTDEINLQL